MKEHNVVAFYQAYDSVPEMTIGTIIHVYPEGAVEVEIEEPHTVILIDEPYKYLVDTGCTKVMHEALQKIVAMLKAGEITQDDIIAAREELERRNPHGGKA